MLRHSLNLWKLSACNLFGINEIRYTKDPDKRSRALGFAILWLVFILMMEGYLIASMLGYVSIGMTDILPIYCYAVTGILILMLTLLKAGNIMFHWNTLETLLSLPLPQSAIVTGRFLSLYTTNLLFTAGVMLPGMIIYGIAAGAGPVAYLVFLIGILFAPLLPLTIATAISAVIKAVSSRMKYKSLVEAGLMILFTVGILLLSSGSNYENITAETIKNLSLTVVAKLSMLYPPAAWFQKAVIEETLLPLLLLILASLAGFAVMLFLLNRYFLCICNALRATGTKHRVRVTAGEPSSLLMALVKREFRYYFSQSLYMANTAMGLFLMAAASIAVCIIGPDVIEAQLPVSGIVVKAFPFVLAMCGCIMSPTSASVSLEGKTRWLTKSLPIPEKTQYDSKLLMALILDLPFYVVSVAVAAIGLSVTGMNLVRLIVIPAVFLVYSAVAGLTANLLFPRFDWENETQAVKQGASVAIAMLFSILPLMITGGLFAAAVILFPDGPAADLVFFLTNGVILAATFFLYRSVRNKVLSE